VCTNPAGTRRWQIYRYYAVLPFDPIGQGERNYTKRTPTQEHTVPGRQMLPVGETATGALLWDAMRSLDVLAY
jgi:hypothetical protein